MVFCRKHSFQGIDCQPNLSDQNILFFFHIGISFAKHILHFEKYT